MLMTGVAFAHSFSGGEQEALAFVKHGFKLGITGQDYQSKCQKVASVCESGF